jgi:hypothetical protein
MQAPSPKANHEFLIHQVVVKGPTERTRALAGDRQGRAFRVSLVVLLTELRMLFLDCRNKIPVEAFPTL